LWFWFSPRGTQCAIAIANGFGALRPGYSTILHHTAPCHAPCGYPYLYCINTYTAGKAQSAVLHCSYSYRYT
jgi:hypothetical protein